MYASFGATSIILGRWPINIIKDVCQERKKDVYHTCADDNKGMKTPQVFSNRDG